MNNDIHKGIFLTGTDTEVGKTFVGSRLVRDLFNRGISVSPRKPAESGCRIEAGQLIPADAEQYHQAIDASQSIETICPYRFEPAVSPQRAAQLAGQELTLSNLVEACHASASDFIAVEGAGGFYSPIADHAVNADLAQVLGLPVLLVASDKLGCINHILLTLEAIRNRGLETVAVILNRNLPDSDADMGNLNVLQSLIETPVFPFPHGGEQSDTGLFDQLLPLLRT